MKRILLFVGLFALFIPLAEADVTLTSNTTYDTLQIATGSTLFTNGFNVTVKGKSGTGTEIYGKLDARGIAGSATLFTQSMYSFRTDGAGSAVFTGTGKLVLAGSGSTAVLKVSSGSLQNLTINNGLVAYWKFDEGQGTVAKDSSGNGWNGTLNNSPTWDSSVPATNFYDPDSLSFNGSSNYVSTSFAMPTTNFTYSFWAKSSVDSPSGNSRPFGAADGTNGTYGTAVIWGFPDSGHLVVVNRQSNVGTLDMNGAVSGLLTGWHFITVSIDSTNGGTLYYDGSVATSNALTTSIVVSTGLNIGKESVGSLYFPGNVDDVRVYNRVLSQPEVTGLYNGNQNTGSGIYLLGSALTVSGNVNIVSGGLDASSSNFGITVGGNWANVGGFTMRNGTVTLNGTQQTLTGSTVFWNFAKTVSSTTTVFFDYTGLQTMSGSITMNGAAGNMLSVRSTKNATNAHILFGYEGTFQSLTHLNVQDSNANGGQSLLCSITPDGCLDSGDNSNWQFGTSYSITGKFFNDIGGPRIANAKVAVSLNGGPVSGTGTTDAGGQFTITGQVFTGGTIMTLYASGGSNRGATVTLGSGGTMTGILVAKNHLIVRSDSGSVAITNNDLRIAKNSGNGDISALYSVNGSNVLTMVPGKKLHVWAGKIYTPGARVHAGDVTVAGTMQMGTNGLFATGALIATTGIFTTSTGVTLATDDTAIKLSMGPNSFQNLTFGLPAGLKGSYDLRTALTVTGDLTIFSGATLDTASENYQVNVAGNWNNLNGKSGFNARSGTVILDGTGNQTMSGTTLFHNLQKTVTTASTLFLDYSGTQIASGSLVLHGVNGNLLSIRSTKAGTAAGVILDPARATQLATDFAYLDVKDSNAGGGQTLFCYTATEGCVDSGNNTNWTFLDAAANLIRKAKLIFTSF